MKRRIIALLIALASLVTMLAACGDDAGKKPCATHVDADKDLICDGCGRAVISIIEQLPPVEDPVVDTVVNPFPENSNLAQFEDLSLVGKPVSGKLEEAEAEPVLQQGMADIASAAKIKVPTKETFAEGETPTYTDSYLIYNYRLGKVIYSYTTPEYTDANENHKVKVSVAPITPALGFEIRVATWAQVKGYTYSYQYYTIGGLLLADTAESEDPDEELSFSASLSSNGDYIYSLEDMIYVCDAKTGAQIYSCEARLFIDRPAFDVVIGNYGYVKDSEGDILVYDLTKWLSCIYETDVEGTAYIFSDGKIVVQNHVVLPDAAVNYDYLVKSEDLTGSIKYDIVYTVINPVDGSSTEVEFGYNILSHEAVKAGEGDALVSYDRLTVSPISHKELTTTAVEVIVDSSLKILYAKEAWLPGQSLDDMQLVADGVYLVSIRYADGTVVKATVKADGTFLAYIPNALANSFVCGFIKVGNKFYNTKMELVFDADAKDAEEKTFTLGESSDYGIYMTKDGETYVLRQGATAPVKLTNAADADENALNDVTFYRTYFGGAIYVLNKKVEVAVEGDAGTEPATELEDVFVFYNAAGTELGSVQAPSFAISVLVADEIYYIETANGDYYFYAN